MPVTVPAKPVESAPAITKTPPISVPRSAAQPAAVGVRPERDGAGASASGSPPEPAAPGIVRARRREDRAEPAAPGVGSRGRDQGGPPRAGRKELPPTPFDAALETILYAADRKLAIIDGRIVQLGDLVRGARVIEITQTAVLLRDEQGRRRELALGAFGR